MKKIILGTVVVFSIIALAGCFNTEKEPTEWSEYVVHSNDTVYGISNIITPNDMDYRNTEYYIIEKNAIENAMIYPGQIILVPVYE